MKDILFLAKESRLAAYAQKVADTKEEVLALRELGFTPHGGEWVAPIPQDLQAWIGAVNTRFHLHIPHHCTFARWVNLAAAAHIQPPFVPASVPTKIPLLPHQLNAIAHFVREKRLLLNAEMGLGKTATAIGAILALQSTVNDILVVVPAALRKNWKKEFELFSHLEPLLLKNGKTESFQPSSNVRLVVVSYGMLSAPCLSTVAWQMIVADECHALKHATSKRSKTFFKLSQSTTYCLLLTGTSAHKTAEMWHQLHILRADLFREFYSFAPPRKVGTPPVNQSHFYFADRYVVVEAVYIKCRRLQYVFKKSRRVDELHALLKPFMLVQTLNDLDTQLPPLIVETITIGEFPKKQSTTFDLELSRLKCIADQRERDCALMALTMQTSKAKQPFIWTYIEHILETYHEKIIVFVYHKEMAAFLHDKLTEHKVDHISITGDTKPDSKRYELLDHFAKTESCRVGILSLGVCAVGFNLTFVNLVLVAELIFDSFAHKQSEGRCHRIGQTKTAVMQYLLMGPVDDILWNSLNTKLRVASHLLAA